MDHCPPSSDSAGSAHPPHAAPPRFPSAAQTSAPDAAPADARLRDPKGQTAPYPDSRPNSRCSHAVNLYHIIQTITFSIRSSIRLSIPRPSFCLPRPHPVSAGESGLPVPTASIPCSAYSYTEYHSAALPCDSRPPPHGSRKSTAAGSGSSSRLIVLPEINDREKHLLAPGIMAQPPERDPGHTGNTGKRIRPVRLCLYPFHILIPLHILQNRIIKDIKRLMVRRPDIRERLVILMENGVGGMADLIIPQLPLLIVGYPNASF